MNESAIRRRFFLAFVFLLMHAAYPPAGYAFALLGNDEFSSSARWSDAVMEQGLTFAIDSDFLTGASGNAAGAVRSAFGTWAEASTSLSFTETNFTYRNPFVGANIDIFSATPDFTYLGTGFDGSLAITLVSTGFDGSILGVDMYFNEAHAFSDNPQANEFDIESIALHEIGHALGLGHPDEADDIGRNYDSAGNPVPASGSEVMHSTIAPGEIARSLTGDELAGLYHLEPWSGGIIIGTAINPASVSEPGTVLLVVAGGLFMMGCSQRPGHAHDGRA